MAGTAVAHLQANRGLHACQSAWRFGLALLLGPAGGSLPGNAVAPPFWRSTTGRTGTEHPATRHLRDLGEIFRIVPRSRAPRGCLPGRTRYPRAQRRRDCAHP